MLYVLAISLPLATALGFFACLRMVADTHQASMRMLDAKRAMSTMAQSVVGAAKLHAETKESMEKFTKALGLVAERLETLRENQSQISGALVRSGVRLGAASKTGELELGRDLGSTPAAPARTRSTGLDEHI